MNVICLTPKHPITKTVVERYLVLSSNQPQTSFNCFPNSNHCLGVIKSKNIGRKTKSHVEFNNDSKSTHYISGIYSRPFRFEIKGPYKEICIDIRPLGLETMGLAHASKESFLVEPLALINPSLTKKLYEIIDEIDNLNSIELNSTLDQILAEAIQLEPSEKFLKLSNQNYLKISDLEKELCVSKRSLYRFFHHNFNITPYQFLEINKLQECMKRAANFEKISSICNKYNFTDHSHFYKFIRKYTNLFPTELKVKITIESNLIIEK